MTRATPNRFITDATRTGIRAVLADRGPRRQYLPGFDADYFDIVHYILRCTYRIWEQRGTELIRSHYAGDARVITLGGQSCSAQAVIDATRATQRSFPDRRLRAEDVIWCRLPGAAGLFSSHRIVSTMTHRAASEFGAADGKAARFRTIADCYVRANRIHLEWLVRDNYAIALQLGKDPWRLAAIMARKEEPAFVRWRYAAAQRLLARRSGTSDEAVREIAVGSIAAPKHPPVPARARSWVTSWLAAINARAWRTLENLYTPRVSAALPRALTVRSPSGISGYWSSLAAALPDLYLVADRVTCLAPSRNTMRIAVRWWGAGKHRGAGRFGRASGAPLLLLGVSHFLWEDGAVRRESTVLDELAVLRQIAHARNRGRG